MSTEERGYRHTPLWRDSARLLLLIEESVRHFPRYHKYAVGTDLRRGAMLVCRLVARASHEPDERQRAVAGLVSAVDDLKIQIQLAKELRAFRQFTEFQAIAELAVAVGKQSGGWRRRVQGKTA